MLPQMAMTSSLAFIAVLLLCFSFSVNPQPYNYLTASAPVSWTNSPSLPHNFTFNDGKIIRTLLRQNGSDGLSFATGFYCSPPCKSFFLSICIVYTYNKDSKNNMAKQTLQANPANIPPQVIWLANRARPVSENATLQLTSKDGLTLRDSDGNLVWSTSGLNRSVAGINITAAGNLVLFDINNSTIWQSFDHPTDCLVMRQTLAIDMGLISNSSSTDFAEGQFNLTLLAGGLYGFVHANPPQVYYHYRKIVDNSTLIKFIDSSLTMFSTLSNIVMGNIFEFPAAKTIQYMRLESDGHLRLYDFDGFTWNIVADLFGTDKCAYPTVCGPYGICNNGKCICPTSTGTLENYFKPINKWQSKLGCSPVTNITCQDVNNHHLLDLNNVSYFNNVDNVAFNATDEETCKKACLGDCSCKAALFQSPKGNSSIGKCLTLTEVLSLQNYQPKAPKFDSSAYIKVQEAPSLALTPSPSSSSKVGLGTILGSTFGALLFMLTLFGIYKVCLRRRQEEKEEQEEQDEDNIELVSGMLTKFTLKELEKATENFSKKLGEGGFGTVFEGSWGGEKIAVKRLNNVGPERKDFLAEVKTIGSIHHINMVRMIGYCAEKFKRLLVYEYMCNGSLDKWIYCMDGRVPLILIDRFKIITDIAKGLCYLHEECRQKIVHFDIKPQNILLDEKFNAKVADFGLSKLIDRGISKVWTKPGGTYEYSAPECCPPIVSAISEKADVYSFGVVVMEILCGRRNIDDSQIEENRYLMKLLEEKSKSNELSDLIDKNIVKDELCEREIVNVMELAMWCLQNNSTRRPSMLWVVKVLEGVMEVEKASLDYNFFSRLQTIENSPNIEDQSTPLLNREALDEIQ